MQLLKPNKWSGWDPALEVTVKKVPSKAGYDSTYLVYVNGHPTGFVASRREQYHSTLWGFDKNLSDLNTPGSPSRSEAIVALIEQTR